MGVRSARGRNSSPESARCSTGSVRPPELHRIIQGETDAWLARPRSHYTVRYRVEPDLVEVIAIFHSHRDPAEWQRRI